MKKPKAIIIGWDAATFDVAQPLIQQGKMPALKRLMEGGSYGRLKSTIPPVTPPAWISFMLGAGQGVHGIFGFTKPDLQIPNQSYSVQTARSVCRGNAFWEYMDRQDGTKSAILFVPMTYPVWETNGIMVAGNPVGSMSRGFTHPTGLEKQYQDCFIGPDYYKLLTTNRSKHLCLIHQIIENRTRMLWKILDRNEFDLIFIVYGATDGIMHKYWKYREPELFKTDPEEQEKYAAALDEQYITVDQKLGELLDRLDDDTLVCLLSDHGSGTAALKNFHLNRWLRDSGYLVERKGVKGKSAMRKLGRWIHWNVYLRKFMHKLPKFVHAKVKSVSSKLNALDFSRTRAFRVPLQFAYDGIAINMNGRQSKGLVQESEYDLLRDEIIQKIVDLKDPETGKKIVVWAKKKEELFHGNGERYAPDIVLKYDESYTGADDTEHLISDVSEQRLRNQSGSHRMYGLFGFLGKQIAHNNEIKGVSIEDLTPTILHALGYPIPKYMTGKLAERVFKRDFIQKNPPKFIDQEMQKTGKKVKVSISEEEEMRDQLRDLGYID